MVDEYFLKAREWFLSNKLIHISEVADFDPELYVYNEAEDTIQLNDNITDENVINQIFIKKDGFYYRKDVIESYNLDFRRSELTVRSEKYLRFDSILLKEDFEEREVNGDKFKCYKFEMDGNKYVSIRYFQSGGTTVNIPATFEGCQVIDFDLLGKIDPDYIHKIVFNEYIFKLPYIKKIIHSLEEIEFNNCFEKNDSFDYLIEGLIQSSKMKSKKISISKTDKNYSSANNIILTKDGKEAIYCLPQSIITVPEGVEVVHDNCIFDTRKIKIQDIKWPTSLRRLDDDALIRTLADYEYSVRTSFACPPHLDTISKCCFDSRFYCFKNEKGELYIPEDIKYFTDEGLKSLIRGKYNGIEMKSDSFKAFNGCIFSKDYKELIVNVSAGNKLVMPDETEIINKAFFYKDIPLVVLNNKNIGLSKILEEHKVKYTNRDEEIKTRSLIDKRKSNNAKPEFIKNYNNYYEAKNKVICDYLELDINEFGKFKTKRLCINKNLMGVKELVIPEGITDIEISSDVLDLYEGIEIIRLPNSAYSCLGILDCIKSLMMVIINPSTGVKWHTRQLHFFVACESKYHMPLGLYDTFSVPEFEIYSRDYTEYNQVSFINNFDRERLFITEDAYYYQKKKGTYVLAKTKYTNKYEVPDKVNDKPVIGSLPYAFTNVLTDKVLYGNNYIPSEYNDKTYKDVHLVLEPKDPNYVPKVKRSKVETEEESKKEAEPIEQQPVDLTIKESKEEKVNPVVTFDEIDSNSKDMQDDQTINPKENIQGENIVDKEDISQNTNDSDNVKKRKYVRTATRIQHILEMQEEAKKARKAARDKAKTESQENVSNTTNKSTNSSTKEKSISNSTTTKKTTATKKATYSSSKGKTVNTTIGHNSEIDESIRKTNELLKEIEENQKLLDSVNKLIEDTDNMYKEYKRQNYLFTIYFDIVSIITSLLLFIFMGKVNGYNEKYYGYPIKLEGLYFQTIYADLKENAGYGFAIFLIIVSIILSIISLVKRLDFLKGTFKTRIVLSFICTLIYLITPFSEIYYDRLGAGSICCILLCVINMIVLGIALKKKLAYLTIEIRKEKIKKSTLITIISLLFLGLIVTPATVNTVKVINVKNQLNNSSFVWESPHADIPYNYSNNWPEYYYTEVGHIEFKNGEYEHYYVKEYHYNDAYKNQKNPVYFEEGRKYYSFTQSYKVGYSLFEGVYIKSETFNFFVNYKNGEITSIYRSGSEYIKEK